MSRNRRHFSAVVALVAGCSGAASAADLSGISNFRQYSETFASSGQPTREQLELLQEEGFERVVYIAFTNHRNSIADEDVLVRDLGMHYVHVPVVWDSPTAADFAAFAGVMQAAPSMKTLLHCQVNYRASAFSFLYRVIHEGVPVAEAKADMNSVWEPNETWRALIFEVLEANDISPHCDGCDWE